MVKRKDPIRCKKQALHGSVELPWDCSVDTVTNRSDNGTFEEAYEDVSNVCEECAPDFNRDLPCVESYLEV